MYGNPSNSTNTLATKYFSTVKLLFCSFLFKYNLLAVLSLESANKLTFYTRISYILKYSHINGNVIVERFFKFNCVLDFRFTNCDLNYKSKTLFIATRNCTTFEFDILLLLLYLKYLSFYRHLCCIEMNANNAQRFNKLTK